MAEDWSAVAQAINARMAELGISQRELIARSHVSKAIVREIQHDVVRRRRSARTLEALSIALDWHPGHLAAVLAERHPPQPGEPRSDRMTTWPADSRSSNITSADSPTSPRELSEIAQEVSRIRDTVDEILNRVSKLTDPGG